MGWLGRLFGTKGPAHQAGFKHIGVLVSGTLFHADLGAGQLKMFGVGDGKVAGVCAAFDIKRRLEATIAENQSVPIEGLTGPWILVIPEDCYRNWRGRFEQMIGGPVIDGRMPPVSQTIEVEGRKVAWTPPSMINVSKAAIAKIEELLEKLPARETAIVEPVPPTSEEPSPVRVTVGACSGCGRELRMKAQAIRPKVHLTCKCGVQNEVLVLEEIVAAHATRR